MKKLLIFLILLMLCPSAFGEGYPPQGGREEYPIYWYLFRHADRLKKVLDTKKFLQTSWLVLRISCKNYA